jgi:hypothetical protein
MSPATCPEVREEELDSALIYIASPDVVRHCNVVSVSLCPTLYYAGCGLPYVDSLLIARDILVATVLPIDVLSTCHIIVYLAGPGDLPFHRSDYGETIKELCVSFGDSLISADQAEDIARQTLRTLTIEWSSVDLRYPLALPLQTRQ